MPVSQEVAARAGAKRKRNAASRYYSVRVGRKPGIYHSWDECHTQVQRYKGSKCMPAHLDPWLVHC
jgi:ribonuclease HI